VQAELARVGATQLALAETSGGVIGFPQPGVEKKFQSQDRQGKYNSNQYLNTHPFHFVSVAGEYIVQEKLCQCQTQAL
jgi:hypothetical protein